MDHVSNLFPDKDKFLIGNTPIQPANLPSFEIQTPEDTLSQKEPAVETEAPQTQGKTDSSKTELIRYTLYKIKDQVDILLHLLDETTSLLTTSSLPVQKHTSELSLQVQRAEADKNARILEGTFTGDKMISDDGEIFTIPANYASKSKLVEGDRMKLTIPENGSFIYKQISPVERRTLRGELVSGGTNGQWLVNAEGKNYRVLTAAITFHKGRIGDEVVLLVPESGMSDWGAVENIIHKDL